MARYLITCASCGTQAGAKRKDAEHCRSCRLLRVLTYAARGQWKRATCRMCGERFIPMRRNDYTSCGSCQAAQKHHAPPTITCGICRQPGHPTEGVNVCLACVKHPQRRKEVVKALKHGQAKRRKAHAEEWKAAAAGERPIQRVRDSEPPVP